MSGCVIMVSAVPDRGTADRISATLVNEELAAAVHIRAVTSRYRWKGAVEQVEEHVLDIYTSADRVGPITARITELHPYEMPGILALPVADGPPAYLEWIRSAGLRPTG